MSGYNNKLYANYEKQIHTLDGWRDYIAGGRSKVARPIANNTTARLIEGGAGIAITLHQTDIITLNSDGTLTLNSGGWRSATTKERINRYTNADISQRGGIWYMRDDSLFYDGMVITADGTPVNPKRPQAYEAKMRIIKRQAKQYAHDFVEALKAGKVPQPSGGDCWHCLFTMQGRTDVTSADHIRQHIKDKYYVPSLMVNAARAAGYQDFQVGMMGIGGQRLFINPERNIYKYVVKQLQGEL